MELLYKSLLKTKELFVLLEDATGDWEKDKNIFTAYYEENEKFINDFDLDDDSVEYL